MVDKLLLFFILCSSFLYSQEVSTVLVNNSKSLLPGGAHSLVFRITNTSTKPITLYPEVVLPNSWNLSNTIDSVTVKANSFYLQIVNLSIPSIAEAQNYPIAYILKTKEGQHIAKEATSLKIKKITKASLSLIEAPTFVKAGDTLKASFTIKNEGNAAQNILLQSTDGEIKTNTALSLLPGQTSRVELHKKTFTGLTKPTYLSIKLQAAIKNSETPAIFAYANTKVIPSIESKQDAFHRFPIEVTGSYLGREAEGVYKDGWQGELYGRGSIDQKGTKVLEFRAVTPDQFDLSAFGQFEEYYANYKTRNFFAHIGDKVYSSSMLSEFARYGRGVEVDATINKWELGAFYNNPRFFSAIEDEFNLSAAYHFNVNNRAKYGVLHKRMNDNTSATIGYFTASTSLSKNINLEAEYSLSTSKEKTGQAYYIKGQASYNKFNATAQYLKADADYQGFYTNSTFINGNVNYRISPKVNVSANFNQDARNIERDTLYSNAPITNNYLVGLQYRYSKNGSIGVYGGHRESEDQLESQLFNYKEDIFRINMSQQIGMLDIDLEGQFNNTDNILTGFENNSTIVTANISFTKFLANFNIFGSYYNTSRFQLDQDQEQYIYGGRISSDFSSKTRFNVSYQNTYSLEEYFLDRSLFEAQVTQQLFRNHEISLIGRTFMLQQEVDRKDYSFMLRYTVGIGIPIKKVHEYASLSGTISNLGVRNIKGIRLILNNKVAITDNKGTFKFNNVLPGMYFFEIDGSTLDLHDIPTKSIPMEVEITQGENFVDFGLTKASSISGKIDINAISRASKEPIAEHESIIVEVSNGKETFRKICLLKDPFEFTYLRPGTWKLKIYRNGLSKLLEIKTTQMELETTADRDTEVVISIYKKERTIRFQKKQVSISNEE